MPLPDTIEPRTDTGAASLERAVVEAGGRPRSADEGATAFRWEGRPQAFVLLVGGNLTVRFRTIDRTVPWAECRVTGGQDCMPVTVAVLSHADIAVQAVCRARSNWLELEPEKFLSLVHDDPEFRRVLFAQHARRLPFIFRRLSGQGEASLDQRIAEWLLAHAAAGEVAITHRKLAADLVTAREVVSRRLKILSERGWIEQSRGRITLVALSALIRLAGGSSVRHGGGIKPSQTVEHAGQVVRANQGR